MGEASVLFLSQPQFAEGQPGEVGRGSLWKTIDERFQVPRGFIDSIELQGQLGHFHQRLPLALGRNAINDIIVIGRHRLLQISETFKDACFEGGAFGLQGRVLGIAGHREQVGRALQGLLRPVGRVESCIIDIANPTRSWD